MKEIDSNVMKVRKQLLQRARIGLSKYGKPTAKSNLPAKAWLRHLQEELLDGAVYCERLIQEIDEQYYSARKAMKENAPAEE